MMLRITHKKSPKLNDERGLVSIIVVVIMMVIISTITLSFARIVRNEQRQALDRQLNTQAQYAAESGINYASKTIEDNIIASPNGSLAPLLKTTCGTNAKYTDALNFDSGVSVSCLLVDTNPRTLVYDLSTANQSKVFPVRPIIEAGNTVNAIEIEWTPQSGDVGTCPDAATAGQLKISTDWTCPFAAIRVDLTNTTLGLGGSDTRRTLAENTFSGILMPVRGGSGAYGFSNGRNAFSGNNGVAAEGVRVPAACTANSCKLRITLPGNNQEYYMRIASLYRDTKVTISMPNTAGSPVGLKDAQVLVDATGKAQDILKRMQVRIPLSGSGTHADFGLQAKDSICKEFSSYPTADYRNDYGC